MNNSFLIFLYTHAESSISLRIYLRRDVFWPYRTRGKATPSVSSVPKCSGASKVPTDTHGAAEISPISSIRTVIEFFFRFKNLLFNVRVFVRILFLFYFGRWQKFDRTIQHHRPKRTWPFWRVWALAVTVSCEPYKRLETTSKQPPIYSYRNSKSEKRNEKHNNVKN